MTELLNCGCGGKAELILDREGQYGNVSSYHDVAYVDCAVCRISTPHITQGKRSGEIAADIWNKAMAKRQWQMTEVPK